MSKNKNKTIDIPIYDIEGQMSFITSVCQDFGFEPQKLIPLILADWICTFQEATSKMSGNAYSAFLSYLKSTNSTSEKLHQIKKYVEESKNEKSKD